ncbi:SNARE associated Golgi protein [Plasmodium gonderi]|uniref:SNARE associated Golgi protein n=1 Tax=Plasmodium gonderi TaxID=77519 RepID=A0A1Y1JND5_PLAGO|nr:SNARE associated Golgi protein [Plasmodium gonderi]GAW81913.1 SNARE associated Golgi protein [Plasmodium gonderi]
MKKDKTQNVVHKTDTLFIPKVKNKELKLHLFYLSLIFASFVAVIVVYVHLMPGLSIESKEKLKTLIPQNFKDLITLNNREKVKNLYDSLISYKNEHGFILLILLTIIYIFYQAFPLFLWWMTGTGTIITILIGAFYNYAFSIFYCSILSTISPLVTYFIFKNYGRTVIEYFFKKSLVNFNEQIKKRVKSKFDLFFYLAILRLTPVFPNALINIMVASLSLPAIPFMCATYIGLIPNTIILVSVGQAISMLSAVDVKQQFYIPITFIVLLFLFQTIVKYKYRGIAL